MIEDKAQGVKCLLHKPKHMSSNPQNAQGTEARICDPDTPTERWEMESRESLGALRPTLMAPGICSREQQTDLSLRM